MLCRYGRFLFAVGLLSYLYRDSTALKPSMSPRTDQIRMKQGELLQLSCSGNSKIFFTYPTIRSMIIGERQSIYNEASHVETFGTKDSGNFSYHLMRRRTVFGDTGWYGCSYYPILTAIRNYSDPTNSWIYVYVEPETVRFVEQAYFEALVFTRDASIVVPCRPTSPNAKVQITGFVVEKNKEFVFTTSFDPRFGFILRDYNPSLIPVLFNCTIAPNEKVSYVARFLGIIPLPEPIINNTFPHLITGESLYVQCSTNNLAISDEYELEWMRVLDGRYEIVHHSVNEESEDITAVLTINHVTYEDEGIYECFMVDEFIPIEKSQMYLQVHDSISPFIHLTARDSKSHYQRRVGDAVLFVVHVEAYPSPKLKWLNKHGDELNTQGDEIPMLSWSRGPKLLADSACCKPTLKIHNLNLNDMGIYSIQADNRYKKESLNFTLEVLAEPNVYMISPHSRYFHNQVAKVECHVEAFPRPNITWSYRKCPNYPSCDDGILEYLTNSGENGTVTHLVSTVSATFEMSGEITCHACNAIGCGNVTESVSVSDEVAEFGIILTMDPVVEGDEWKLICAASTRNYPDTFDWSNESGPIVQSERISIYRESTQFSHRSILRIRNVTMEDSQEYVCTGKSMDTLTRSAGYRLEVTAARAPIITDTNLKKDEIIFDLNTRDRKRVYFYCLADGAPKPSISWFKDGAQLVVNDKEHKFTNNSQQLELEYPLLEIDSGEYMCRAENRIGKAEVSQRIKFLTIKEFKIVTKIPVPVIISLVTLAVVVLILVIYVGLKIRHHRMGRRKLEESRFLRFEKGAIESLNPDLTVDEQAHLLPYDKKWEFPREKLKLGKHLGSGAFGVVLKAEARGICEGEAVTTVAVKTVRNSPNITHICALSSELKIMVHLGKHLNVVNLLGACTKKKLTDELLVIVEFCRFGNLEKYLSRHRSGFINQIDPATGKLDLSIGHDLLTRTANVSSTKRISETDSMQSYATTINFQCIGMTTDGPLRNNDSTQAGWSSCRGDYKDSDLKPIRTQDLLSWAFQVARGMEYLSQRRILHGDLAARNILLADDNVVKICDFGLAKSMYKEDIYKKMSNCRLPVKWLAIETMRDQIFSTQSDIWSFGIVLWEFFTLANTPYPGIQAERVYKKLIEGYRMEQPEYATREVYDIMCHCWNANPPLRPSFTDLVGSIGNMLEDNERAQYIKLNAPYMDMNRHQLQGERKDYLKMFPAPDYVMLSSPNPDHTNSPASEIMDAVETSHLLKKEEQDSYLRPINVDDRTADLTKIKALMKDQVVHPDRDCANRNPPNILELTDFLGADRYSYC